ncbi:MAG TPA: carbohydrate binding domain-containing protein, partial [bacterium]
MKKITGVFAMLFLLQTSLAFGAMVQDWSSLGSGAAGTYQDSTGSKVDFTIDAGPKGGQKALKITTNLVASGYAGIYTNTSGDISKAGSLKFMAKSTVAGEILIAIKDAYNFQYSTRVSVPAGDWVPVSASLSAFTKDTYTPPDAIAGHPMDFSKISNLNFSPQMQGASVVLIGPVETDGTASASTGTTASSTKASAAAPAAASAPAGPGAAILDCTGIANDGKNAGTFQDSKGSSFTFAIKDNPSKKGKQYLTITYDLQQGGYCGMWCRAGGSDWKGADLSSAKMIYVTIYSKTPVILGLALKDKGNNQYVASTPATKGGK